MHPYQSIFEAIPSGRTYSGSAPARPKAVGLAEPDYLRKHGVKIKPSPVVDDVSLEDAPDVVADDERNETSYLKKFGPVVTSREDDVEEEEEEEEEEEDYLKSYGHDEHGYDEYDDVEEEADDYDSTSDYENDYDSLDFGDEFDPEVDPEEERRKEITNLSNFHFPHNVEQFSEPVARVLTQEGNYLLVKYVDEFEAKEPLTIALVPAATSKVKWVDKENKVVRIPEGGNAYDGYMYLVSHNGKPAWKAITYTQRAKDRFKALISKAQRLNKNWFSTKSR